MLVKMCQRKGTERKIDDDDGCPYCTYVHEFVAMNSGDVTFVEGGGERHRVECIMPCMYVCGPMTAEDEAILKEQ